MAAEHCLQFENLKHMSFASGAAWTIARDTLGPSSGQTIAGFAAGDTIILEGSRNRCLLRHVRRSSVRKQHDRDSGSRRVADRQPEHNKTSPIGVPSSACFKMKRPAPPKTLTSSSRTPLPADHSKIRTSQCKKVQMVRRSAQSIQRSIPFICKRIRILCPIDGLLREGWHRIHIS